MYIAERLWILHLNALWKLFMLHFSLFGQWPRKGQPSLLKIHVGFSLSIFFLTTFFSFTLTYALPDLNQSFWSPQRGFGVTHYPFCGSYHLFWNTYHPICSTHYSFWSPPTIGPTSSEILPHPPRSLQPHLRNYFIRCTLRPSVHSLKLLAK